LTTSYTLDPDNRISERIDTGTTGSTEQSFYDGSADDPAWTQDLNGSGVPNGTWNRNITGIDGALDAIQSNTGTQLQLSNLHGDVIGTAPIAAGGTVSLNSCETDEYGDPCASGGTTTRYSYLGAKEKPTALPSGIINMGARVYDPYTGTFMQTDPDPGAGANAYGYTDGDPVNETDLTGANMAAMYIYQGRLNACNGSSACVKAVNKSYAQGPTWGDVVQILTWATAPAALIDPFEDAGLAAEDGGEALSDGWQGTNRSDEDSFNYHYAKHGAGNTPEQYARDAKDFANNPAGTRTEVQLGDGTTGARYRTPGGGRGGILHSSGKVVSFWYH
jgi:RHS repeat-associated protein